MTAETGPPTETPSPQKKALKLAEAILKLRDSLGDLIEAGDPRRAVGNLYSSVNQVERDVLDALTVGEGRDYHELQGFASAIFTDPRRGTEIVKSLMETRRYSLADIDSFIQTVETTKKYRDAAAK